MRLLYSDEFVLLIVGMSRKLDFGRGRSLTIKTEENSVDVARNAKKIDF